VKQHGTGLPSNERFEVRLAVGPSGLETGARMQHTGTQDAFELGLAVAQSGTHAQRDTRGILEACPAHVSELRIVGTKAGHVSPTRADVPIKAHLRKDATAALRVHGKRQTAVAAVGLIGIVGHRNAVTQGQIWPHLGFGWSTHSKQ